MTEPSTHGFKWDYEYIGNALSGKRVRLRVTSNATGYALAMICDNRAGFGDWLGKMAKLEDALEDWDNTHVCPLPDHARIAQEPQP